MKKIINDKKYLLKKLKTLKKYETIIIDESREGEGMSSKGGEIAKNISRGLRTKSN